jgi:N-methylhydantoinase A
VSEEPTTNARRVRLGVDVGGTFTDIVSIDEDGTDYAVLKIPSTPDDPSIAVLSAVSQMIELDRHPAVTFLGHGTTAGTNAFLTKRGAVTALLTTAGFEDVLEFRRTDRTGILDPYDLQLRFPPPLVPRRRRIGVNERIGLGGVVVTPLTDEEVERAVATVAALGVDAVAIALLWAFENPAHEQLLKAGIEQALPDVFVTCSHEIDPTMMEYERTSTTVVNAYLGPLIQRYFAKVATAMTESGSPEPRIMQSNGGLTSIREAERRPVALLESGPAAGVAACSYLSASMGVENVLAVDMGGTSFDVALIVGGQPQQNIETEVDGYAVRVPMLDIRSIGAGGGSIAWVDAGGALRVGPQSAGSAPGPVCYGRGGTLPTVSDANAVLGYLQDLTGGTMKLDVEAAQQALAEHIGAPLGMSGLEAASGIYRVVNAHMADAMRVIVSEAAINPSDLSVMAYGGAGPVHASALAREMDIRTTIIPRHPGALSALGAATGDLLHDLVDPVMRPLAELDSGDLAARFGSMIERGRATLADEGIPPSDISFQPYVVARYIGQMHDLQVPLEGLGEASNPAQVAARFHQRYWDVYGIKAEDEPVLVISARVRAVGRIQKPSFAGGTSDLLPVPLREVRAWFEHEGVVDVPLYARVPWRPDNLVEGPAIIQEYDSTTVVLPAQTWRVDALGSLIIEEA